MDIFRLRNDTVRTVLSETATRSSGGGDAKRIRIFPVTEDSGAARISTEVRAEPVRQAGRRGRSRCHLGSQPWPWALTTPLNKCSLHTKAVIFLATIFLAG